MYAKTLSAIAVISAAAVAAQDDTLKVNTPTFVAQCKPVKITWQGGESPYHLYVTAPGNIREVKCEARPVQYLNWHSGLGPAILRSDISARACHNTLEWTLC